MSAAFSKRDRPRRYRLPSDLRLLLEVLLVAAPALCLLAWFWLTNDESLPFRLVISALVLGWVLLLAQRVRHHFVYHLRTLSTLVEAINLEDYSFRSSRFREPGVLGELYSQLNTLADRLRQTELQEKELRGLLGKIIAQIEVAIIAIDDAGSIRLVNPAATQLAARPAPDLIGQAIADTPFSVIQDSTEPVVMNFDFPGASGRWQIHWQDYRHEGRPGRLLFITDLAQVLHQEEVRAWQRLIRVISHEINNSLTPIASISQTLGDRVSSGAIPGQDEDFVSGLSLISQRARDLTGFVNEYARIARLPEPEPLQFPLCELLKQVTQLYERKVSFVAHDAKDDTVFADPTLIEQLLINLIKNSLEAMEDGAGDVELTLELTDHTAVIQVLDSGHGLANPDNLFIPFYTTKTRGSGIGLLLCRQIAQAHHGRLSLDNRSDGMGAVATLELPR